MSIMSCTYSQAFQPATGWSYNDHPKKTKQLRSDLKRLKNFNGMVKLAGGTYNQGEHHNHDIYFNLKDSDLIYDESAYRVSVNPFYISEHEVTNEEYRSFVSWTVDSLTKAHPEDPNYCYYDGYGLYIHKCINPEVIKYNDIMIYPDTVYSTLYYELDSSPLSHLYFSHPGYKKYPVGGVNWYQATAYCSWRTMRLHEEALKKGIHINSGFRLPTNAEWGYAISEDTPSHYNNTIINHKGQIRCNISRIVDENGLVVYQNCWLKSSTRVKKYHPNSNKLYDMTGNVSEWIADKVNESVWPIRTVQADTCPYFIKVNNQVNQLTTRTDKIEYITLLMNNKAEQIRKISTDDSTNIYSTYITQREILNNLRNSLITNTVDARIIKGGSLNNSVIYQLPNASEIKNAYFTSPYTGFRVAMSVQ